MYLEILIHAAIAIILMYQEIHIHAVHQAIHQIHTHAVLVIIQHKDIHAAHQVIHRIPTPAAQVIIHM